MGQTSSQEPQNVYGTVIFLISVFILCLWTFIEECFNGHKFSGEITKDLILSTTLKSNIVEKYDGTVTLVTLTEPQVSIPTFPVQECFVSS